MLASGMPSGLSQFLIDGLHGGTARTGSSVWLVLRVRPPMMDEVV
jgi:hypothetical protein